MKIGYSRVSTDDQNLDLQKDALKQAECERIYEDKITGSKMDRPGLNSLKDAIRENDVIIVWRLDRLGRSLKELIEIVTWLESQKVGLVSLNESINTTTITGKLIFHIFGAIAEFERNLIRERTQAGLKAARARGRVGGRPRKLSDDDILLIEQLYTSNKIPLRKIMDQFNISKPTIYKAVKLAKTIKHS